MIAIVNVSKRARPTGWHNYEVRINHDVIAVFRHKREEGLEKCLRLAADAVKKVRVEDDMNMWGLSISEWHE